MTTSYNERSVGQDPQNPDNNNDQNHPEFMPPSSQDFFNRGIPANLYTGPAPIDRDPSKNTKRTLAIAGGALAMTIVVGAGAYFGFKSGVNDVAEKYLPPQDPGIGAPQAPGEIAQPQELSQEELSLSVLDSKERFDSISESLPAQIDEELVRLGWGDYNIKTAPIASASENMTPQEVIDRNFAKAVWVQTNPNKVLALDDIDLIAQPGTDIENDLRSYVNGGKVQEDPRVVIKSIRFNKGYYSENGLTIYSNGLPTLLVASMGVINKDNVIEEYQFHKSADGKSGEWREIRSIESNDPGWVNPMTLDTVLINPDN